MGFLLCHLKRREGRKQTSHSQLATADRVLRSTSANQAERIPSIRLSLHATSPLGCHRRFLTLLTFESQLHRKITEDAKNCYQPGTSKLLLCPKQTWLIHLENVLRNTIRKISFLKLLYGGLQTSVGVWIWLCLWTVWKQHLLFRGTLFHFENDKTYLSQKKKILQNQFISILGICVCTKTTN